MLTHIPFESSIITLDCAHSFVNVIIPSPSFWIIYKISLLREFSEACNDVCCSCIHGCIISQNSRLNYIPGLLLLNYIYDIYDISAYLFLACGSLSSMYKKNQDWYNFVFYYHHNCTNNNRILWIIWHDMAHNQSTHIQCKHALIRHGNSLLLQGQKCT